MGCRFLRALIVGGRENEESQHLLESLVLGGLAVLSTGDNARRLKKAKAGVSRGDPHTYNVWIGGRSLLYGVFCNPPKDPVRPSL